jgi:hypothetical protein
MRDDARKIVNRANLVSCMNNTKWNQLLESINAIRVEKRVKYIDSDDVSNWQHGVWMPSPGYVEFSGGPTPFRFIEWLEIRKADCCFGPLAAKQITDRSQEIRVLLDSQLLDVVETESSFIVHGYRRASEQSVAPKTRK